MTETFVNLTEKEFDALINCLEATHECMAGGDGYISLGWDLQDFRAYQRLSKKVYDRHAYAIHVLKIK